MLSIYLLLISCSVSAENISSILAKYTQQIPSTTRQLIIVKATKKPMANVFILQKNANLWTQVFPTIEADVGSQGISSNKIEGDDKTPAGLFALGPAFSSESLALKTNYRHVNSLDKFIDDADDKNYNHWVHGETKATSYETMLREDGVYKYGVVINYNMHPVVPGRGSAIFMHIWYGPNIGSTGCVTMSEENMLKILHWLDGTQNPYILITN